MPTDDTTATTSGRAGVLQAPQVAGAGQHDQLGGDAEQADAQEQQGVVLHRPGRAERPHEGLGRDQPDADQHDADEEGQPHPLHRLVGRLARLVGAEQAGHRSRGAVGQEDEDRVEEQQDAAGHGQAGELVGAEVADDGGVAEDVERLGHQRAQRGHGQPEDLAVVRVAAERAAHPCGDPTLRSSIPLVTRRRPSVTSGLMTDPEHSHGMKPHSYEVTDGFERAPARAMLRAVGMTDDDWDKPQVGGGLVVERGHAVQPAARPSGQAGQGGRAVGRRLPARVHDHRRERRHLDGPRGHAGLAREPRGHRRLGRAHDPRRAARRAGVVRRVRQVAARHADGLGPLQRAGGVRLRRVRSCRVTATARRSTS